MKTKPLAWAIFTDEGYIHIWSVAGTDVAAVAERTGKTPTPLYATPVVQAEQSKAAADVLAERRRQIEAEGWTPEHDDEHTLGELGLAAALYALPYDAQVAGEPLLKQDDFIGLHMVLDFTSTWRLKPEPDARKRLIKAGALILAEIERLDRQQTGSPEGLLRSAQGGAE